MADIKPEDRMPEADIVTDGKTVTVTDPDPVADALRDDAVVTDALRDDADAEGALRDETGRVRDSAADLPPPMTPATRRERRGRAVFLGLVLGGIVAVGLGFAVARFVPQGWPLGAEGAATDTAALEGRLAALEAEVRVTATAEPVTAQPDPRLDAVTAEVAALRAALADRPAPVASPDPALADRLDAIDQRLSALEQAPTASGGAAPTDGGVPLAAFAALQAEVNRLRDGATTGASDASQAIVAEVQAAAEAVTARLDEAEARAQALTEATEAATQGAARTATFARLRTAIDTGLPFDAALADLTAAGVEVPESLTAAATGVPTIAALQDSFPAAARAALEASLRADMGDTFGERLGSFLQNQTGARSLEPREGTDPDAVLSRAEAALRAGDLQSALDELTGLPPEGQAAITEWVEQAQARIAVQDAVASLAAQAEN